MVRRAMGAMLLALSVLASAAMAVDEMPGTWGEIGKSHIFDTRGHKLLFRVVSLEYRIDPVVIGDAIYAPKADEKLLVVHYVLQNAETTPYTVAWSSVALSVVDSTEATCKAVSAMGAEADRKSVNIELKPAQKIEVYRVVRVAAAGPAKKLIAMRGEPPVVRYDLLEKCKPTPLPKELADPADPTGTTPAQPLAAKIGAKLALGEFQVTVDGWQAGVATADGKAPKAGRQWVFVAFTVTNLAPTEERFQGSTVRARLVSGEEQAKARTTLYSAETDTTVTVPMMPPGTSRSLRWLFEAPATLTAPRLELEWQTTDRKAVIDLPTP